MKKIVCLVFAFAALNACAQVAVWHEVWPQKTAAEIRAEKEAEEAAHRSEIADQQKYFIPRDPWRVFTNYYGRMGGPWQKVATTNYAKGPSWFQFDGEVKAIIPHGVLVDGWIGPPMDFTNGVSNVFIVLNFPYAVKIGTRLQQTGKFVATPVMRRFVHGDLEFYRSFPQYDYGKPTQPPYLNDVAKPQAVANTNEYIDPETGLYIDAKSLAAKNPKYWAELQQSLHSRAAAKNVPLSQTP